jgi:hypothetical protein
LTPSSGAGFLRAPGPRRAPDPMGTRQVHGLEISRGHGVPASPSDGGRTTSGKSWSSARPGPLRLGRSPVVPPPPSRQPALHPPCCEAMIGWILLGTYGLRFPLLPSPSAFGRPELGSRHGPATGRAKQLCQKEPTELPYAMGRPGQPMGPRTWGHGCLAIWYRGIPYGAAWFSIDMDPSC